MTLPREIVRVDDELSLEPRDPADAAEMYALIEAHRADLGEWLPWVDDNRSVADARGYAIFAVEQWTRGMLFDFAIRERGTIVGAIGIHHVDRIARSAQIGYWLAPPNRGRGIMTRAAATLTLVAIRALGLRRIEIRTDIENANSRAVAQRLGYAFERILKNAALQGGTLRDTVVYATISEDGAGTARGVD